MYRQEPIFPVPDNSNDKMPILAFTRDTVPDLFPLYASQIFEAILPSQLKYCVTVLEIIPEISSWKRHDWGRYISGSRAVQGYLYFPFIYCITLFEIIPEIAVMTRGRLHIWLRRQKVKDNIIVEDKKLS